MRSPAPKSLVADRYAIDAPIGRGRSTVYRGRDTRLGRPVAMKEVRLHSDDESLDRVRRRALREARAAARLSHPSVVTVYDVIEEDHSIWLVMELVDAPSLSQLVADRGRLDHARAAMIGADVLGALEAAHSVGVVHRDVKPANVLVALGQRAKLADFGVALLHDDTRVTATGLIIGSPAYMAPEQALGEAVSPATDLWALGATLYYAYEGRPPFDGGSAVATASAVVHGTPRAEEHPGPLSAIVARLLDKDPTARPPVRELHEQLLEIASSPPPPSAGPATGAAAAAAAPVAEATGATAAIDPGEVALAGADPITTQGESAAPAPAAAEPGADAEPAADSEPPAGVDPEADPDTEVAEPTGADVGTDTPVAEPTGAAPATALTEVAPVAGPATARTEVAPVAGPATSRTEVAPVADPATSRTEVAPAAAPAAVPAGISSGEDREPPGPRPRRSGRGPASTVRLVVVAVLVLVALVWALTFDPDDLLGDGGGERDQTAEQEDDSPSTTDGPDEAAAAPPDAEAEAEAEATATTEAETTTTAPTTTTPPAASGVPAGWQAYTHPEAGYTIAHPAGWQVVPSGHRVDIKAPGSSTYLRVDWTDEPKDDPVADWQAQAQSYAGRHAGYQEHRIEAYSYRDYNAAVWEYSWDAGGTRLHAVNLGFVVGGTRGYALNFVTAEGDWAAAQSTFEGFTSSFQP